MSIVTIYQFDPSGFSTGESREVDDRFPLSSGWTTIQPPSLAEGEQAKFDGETWTVVRPVQMPSPPPPTPPVEPPPPEPIPLIYELGPAAYWTGKTMERAAGLPLPSGWTARTPPTLADGEFAQLGADGWTVTTVPMPAPYVPPEPVDLRPTIQITQVTVDEAHAAHSLVNGVADVTLPTGSVLTVTAELRDGEGNVLPVSDSFRMPIVSRDGREKGLLARMEAGVITIAAPMKESGVWQVEEGRINESLPTAAQMRFAGFKIYVVESA